MSTKIKVFEKQPKLSDIDNQILRKFEIKKRLGKGAYGIVWKAIDKTNNKTVAVKKIFDAFLNETDAQRTFREIMFLKAFRHHPNIIQLYDVHRASNNIDIYLSFEFMESDLHNVIKRGTVLKDVHRRYIMYQLLNALRYIHSGNVIHRDLKPSNILLDSKCRCKIADFGLARSISKHQINNSNNNSSITNFDKHEPVLTDYVATRWYRAPEILVASKKYTKGIDMWSIGCILGEMLRGQPLFPGSSTINQIEKIMAALPEVTEQDIKAMGLSFGTILLNQQSNSSGPKLDDLIHGSSEDAKHLVKSLLLFNPCSRLTADQALTHKYIAKFRHTISEIELSHDIIPPLRDDIQLSISEYRSKVYEIAEVGAGDCSIRNQNKLKRFSLEQNGSKLEDSINVTAINSTTTQSTRITGTRLEFEQNTIGKKIPEKLNVQSILSSTNLKTINNKNKNTTNLPRTLKNKSSDNIYNSSANNTVKITKRINDAYTMNSSTTTTTTNKSKSNIKVESLKNPKIKYCKTSNMRESSTESLMTSSTTSHKNDPKNNLNQSCYSHYHCNSNSLNRKKLNVAHPFSNLTDNKRHSIDCGNTDNIKLSLLNNNKNRLQSTSTTIKNIDKNNFRNSMNFKTLGRNSLNSKNNQSILDRNEKSSTIQSSLFISENHQQNNQHTHKQQKIAKKTLLDTKNNGSRLQLSGKKLDNSHKISQINNNKISNTNMNHYHHEELSIPLQHDNSFDNFYEKKIKQLEEKIQRQKKDITKIFHHPLSPVPVTCIQATTQIPSATVFIPVGSSNANATAANEKQLNTFTTPNTIPATATPLLPTKSIKVVTNNNYKNINERRSLSHLLNLTYSNSAKRSSDKKKIHLLRSKSESSNTTNNLNNKKNNCNGKQIKSPSIIKFDYTYPEGDLYCNSKMKKKGIISEFGVITAKELFDLRKPQVIP